MKKIKNHYFFYLFLICLPLRANAQHNGKTQIMFVGFDHLSQLSDGTPQSDVFSSKKQKEIARLADALKDFEPDMIMVEREPKEQHYLDSLYSLYTSGKLKLKNIEYGNSETFQLGFRLAGLLHHKGVYGIDHYESTSQSLLQNGNNIALFREGLKQLQELARPLKQKVQHDSLSIYSYIRYMNKPETIQMTHRLFYNLPAYVTEGTFSESGTNTVDLGKIDEDYIGAEYITLFYNRNLKIYSNILTAQSKNGGKKLLVILGQAHIGVLQDLFEDNPDYTIIPPLTYLKEEM